jgi:glycosyltransferase involved in cell wall biosynthesis
MTPGISVVVPVYNRGAELHRALLSLQQQTYENFECIVVDDASTLPIAPIVASLVDDRFEYIRQSSNGGPYSARMAAFRVMQGELAISLDSDDEAYPWMLQRAVKHLEDTREVDGVAGMYVRASDNRLLVRVEGGSKIMSPSEYVRLPSIPNCLGAVRRCVVEEWLEKRDDYFAFEIHQWFTFHIRHSQLFVDEPWARTHVGGIDRVSVQWENRQLDDYLKFVEEHGDYVERSQAVVIDEIVADGWFQLRRAGRKEDAARFADIMSKRNLKRTRVVAARATRKARRLVPLLASDPTYCLR